MHVGAKKVALLCTATSEMPVRGQAAPNKVVGKMTSEC